MPGIHFAAAGQGILYSLTNPSTAGDFRYPLSPSFLHIYLRR
ncbi:hypothetical protein SBF1_2240007 [Candidatus Desulfosporosinus infrequens]|uniref:Uncharacterized protein n=1 Tax=Candidatus Desulfosporosinus infrequens TaxID=2043169 RepID=A0A2U3KLK3_9FIRM|nr:hypothetical protein SBF1_2240007 [Candidatus Desulfosporosinus infrequens]